MTNPPSVKLTLEHVSPRQRLALVERDGTLHPLLKDCIALIAMSQSDPSGVDLVVTGDFVASVQKRDPKARNYSVERGSGLVAGRTLPGPKGTAAVIMPADLLLTPAGLTPVQTIVRHRLVRYTAAHEGQHAAARINEAPLDMPTEPFRDWILYGAAAVFLDEYRAELGVPANLNPDGRAYDLESELAELVDALERACDAQAQDPDIDTWCWAVMSAFSLFWRRLAYLAAWAKVEGSTPGASVVPANRPAWVKFIAPYWGDFVAALAPAPPGATPMPSAVGMEAVAALAALQAKWIETFGFEWLDTGDGRGWFGLLGSRAQHGV